MSTRLDKHGNAIGVQEEIIDAAGVKIPWLDPVKMVQWLSDAKCLHHLTGNISFAEFWKRFSRFQPNHIVFDGGRPLHRTIPFLSHGDEGRTKKKKPALVWSMRGVAGRGTRLFRERSLEEQTERMGLNLDNSLVSRYLHVVVPGRLYAEDDAVWQAIAARIGQSYHELLTVGFQHEGQQWFAACVGLTGDSPFLAKAGTLIRSFSRVVKKTGTADPKGVCFRCLAGQRNFPMEDLGLNAAWMDTEFTAQLPWNSTPPFLEKLQDVRPEVLQYVAWWVASFQVLCFRCFLECDNGFWQLLQARFSMFRVFAGLGFFAGLGVAVLAAFPG